MPRPPLSDDKDGSPEQSGGGVGGRLRAARLECGLDLEEIAARLHLSPSLIDALEAERYEALPGPAFIPGYIRSFAREVGIEPEPLLAAYRSAQGRAQPARARVWAGTQAGDQVGRGSGRLLVRLMTVLVVVGLGYLFAQWWQGRAPLVSELAGGMAPGLGGEAERATTATADVLPPAPPSGGQDAHNARHETPATGAGTSTGGEGATTATVPQAPDAASPAGTVTPVVPGVASLTPQGVAPAESPAEFGAAPGPGPTAGTAGEVAPVAGTPEAAGAPQPPAAEGLEQGEVVLEFRGPCWVDVRDATKSFSLTGEMGKGDRRVLGGTPPYSIILGNATAVAITVRGAPFDLTAVAKGSVARFKLDPANLP